MKDGRRMSVENAGEILKKFYAAVLFELETRAPAAATTLVAEWHQIKNGKISRVESAFDGRPFAAMFTGQKRA